jgi:hypothetical protein
MWSRPQLQPELNDSQACDGGGQAQDELAVEIEGDPLGDARLDRRSRQQAEEPLLIPLEPGEMQRPHQI